MSQTAFILVLSSDTPLGEAVRDQLRDRYDHSCRVTPTLDDAIESIRARTPDALAILTPLDAAAIGRLTDAMAAASKEAVLLAPSGTDLGALDVRVSELPDSREAARLAGAINAAASKAVARREDRALRDSIADRRIESFHGIVGVSTAIRKIIDRIKKAASNKLTVLILGETGSGKDLIAEAVHKASDRASKPFKAINCAGLNENLLESELFGHVRGAFTGAVADRKGYFVAADGGSLFLDEIGDMPLTMQAKLLRVLERREIVPVGSTDVRRVDVRVIAATNVDLQRSISDRKFRDDLYYRLHQWVIEVPPLRERRDDIPFLADHFRRRANAAHGVACEGISSEAMALLAKYFWPGNVRELANVIETTVVEVGERQVEAGDLPERIRGSRDLVPLGGGGFVGLTMEQIERLVIERTLQATEGNREQAAKMLNIGTRTLYRKIKEYGL